LAALPRRRRGDADENMHEESANDAHLVIPAPAAALSEEELKLASGGFGMMWG